MKKEFSFEVLKKIREKSISDISEETDDETSIEVLNRFQNGESDLNKEKIEEIYHIPSYLEKNEDNVESRLIINAACIYYLSRLQGWEEETQKLGQKTLDLLINHLRSVDENIIIEVCNAISNLQSNKNINTKLSEIRSETCLNVKITALQAELKHGEVQEHIIDEIFNKIVELSEKGNFNKAHQYLYKISNNHEISIDQKKITKTKERINQNISQINTDNNLCFNIGKYWNPFATKILEYSEYDKVNRLRKTIRRSVLYFHSYQLFYSNVFPMRRVLAKVSSNSKGYDKIKEGEKSIGVTATGFLNIYGEKIIFNCIRGDEADVEELLSRYKTEEKISEDTYKELTEVLQLLFEGREAPACYMLPPIFERIIRNRTNKEFNRSGKGVEEKVRPPSLRKQLHKAKEEDLITEYEFSYFKLLMCENINHRNQICHGNYTYTDLSGTAVAYQLLFCIFLFLEREDQDYDIKSTFGKVKDIVNKNEEISKLYPEWVKKENYTKQINYIQKE